MAQISEKDERAAKCVEYTLFCVCLAAMVLGLLELVRWWRWG